MWLKTECLQNQNLSRAPLFLAEMENAASNYSINQTGGETFPGSDWFITQDS